MPHQLTRIVGGGIALVAALILVVTALLVTLTSFLVTPAPLPPLPPSPPSSLACPADDQQEQNLKDFRSPGKESPVSFGPRPRSITNENFRKVLISVLCGGPDLIGGTTTPRGGNLTVYQAIAFALGERRLNQPLSTSEWKTEVTELVENRIPWDRARFTQERGRASTIFATKKGGRLVLGIEKIDNVRTSHIIHLPIRLAGGAVVWLRLRADCLMQPVTKHSEWRTALP